MACQCTDPGCDLPKGPTMGGNGKIEVFQRTDGLWAWHLKAGNGQIIATDGGQGYENRADAEDMAHRVVNGETDPS